MLTVLVVDDDPSTRLLIRRMLTLCECESAEACNGVEGEHLALEINPDIVLLDLMMPVQDGYQTCKNLRDKGFTGTVIFVSALLEASEQKRTADSGANAYIQKPISRDILKMHIDHVRAKTPALR